MKILSPRVLSVAACTSLALAAWSHGGEMRVFRSAEGKPLTASFEGMTGDIVTLKREDGKTFELPKSKLSGEDQLYIAGLAAASGDLARKLNTAAGQEIASGVPFPSRKADELAKLLKLRPESQSKYGRSWRLYAAFAKEEYKLFGAMPYSVALYSNEGGLATSMSIVYANKGDFGSTAGMGQDHFKGGTTATAKTLTAAMEQDEQTVAAALTSVLGAGKTERYGEGKTRRKVTRWDWNGQAFLLSNEEGEYVSLAIVPPELADAGGKSSLTKDADVKKRLLASIVKADNGDVSISEIPMVDQGPKGYCVPATFERAMRTMGLEADMYLLAMVGQSQAGGGTSVELLLDNVRHQVLSKGRRIKDEPISELRVRDVKRYIDQGIPIMWRLCSMPAYNKIADQNTATRAKVTDWKTYATEIATAAAELAKSTKPEEQYHVCMIIGYNEATQEIAVSDSWGASFERRWVPVSVANWASNGGIFMILP
ncbi:hypothetical protein JIN84_10090 [Luteolibacter yonseiensis]|uniref:Peptidase C39-like domain-containing protein n=1 Tax=Luteolibacter yonseiensis TaxID=1144680 RepID=A0A934R331_9BACT|nr:hypothetical protein [Luteolibacter yonseiensis]MBK1815969.1 hypothetical protein [Luteolibacter yonseiensis]